MNFFSRILAKCGGVHISTLEKCPVEASKYVAVGITIIFTGIFASLSGGYAFYKVFNKEVPLYEVTLENSTDSTNLETKILLESEIATTNDKIIAKKEIGKKSTFINGAILMGLLWGFMIFNLDRFIVMSMKKQNKIGKELLVAIPRIILAIIISLVVAKPLEVRLFQDRIAAQISDNELEKREQNRRRIYGITDKSTIDSLKSSSEDGIANLKIELKQECPSIECKDAFNAKKIELEKYYDVRKKVQPLINEADKNIQFVKNSDKYKVITIVDGVENKELSTEGRNLLSKYRRVFNSNIEKRKAQWAKYQSKLATYNTLNSRYRNSKSEELKAAESRDKNLELQKEEADKQTLELEQKSSDAANIAYTNNFITQIEALGDLTKWNYDELDEDGNIIEEANNTMWYMNLAIILLFIVIETAPIFVKLISNKGQYDIAIEADDTKRETEIIHEANTDIAIAEQKSQLKLQLLMNNHQAQLGMLQTAIQSWQNQKTQELNNGQLSDSEYRKIIQEILAFDMINSRNE